MLQSSCSRQHITTLNIIVVFINIKMPIADLHGMKICEDFLFFKKFPIIPSRYPGEK
jgi:hypothetical protein